MLSRIFFKKYGSGKPKSLSSDTSHNTLSSNEDERSSPPKEDRRKSSSRFYMGMTEEVCDSVDNNPDKSERSLPNSLNFVVSRTRQDISHSFNSVIAVVEKPSIASDDNGTISDINKSQVTSAKPEIMPKPRATCPSQPPRMPSPIFSGKTSPGVVKSPSPPWQLLSCSRASIYPPARPPTHILELQNQGLGRNGESQKPSESRGVMAPVISIVRAPRNPRDSLSGTNRGSRRSFTTDDADIGLYKKPSFVHDPSTVHDTLKPKPVVLRNGKDSTVGRKVDMFERITCRRSRSFSTDKKPHLPSVIEESQSSAAKPKPPMKPKFIHDAKSISKSLSPPVSSPVSDSSPEMGGPAAGSSNKWSLPLRTKEKPEIAAKSSEKPAPTFVIGQAPVLSSESEKSCSGSEEKINRSSSNEKEASISDEEYAYEFSESEFDSSEEYDADQNPENRATQVEKALKPIDKAKKVADELLKTEVAYVGRLKLLDQVFHMEIMNQNREEHFLPDDVIPQMFSSIKSILLFHNDFLLPQLHSCVTEWDSQTPRVGQALKKFAPFLKLYTDYVKNFENATSLIALWQARSPRFASCLDELQRRPECGNLALQHHLLEPIQRVPRYELLLRDYIKHLPEDSEDSKHASEALELVTHAAQHSNTEMRKIEKFRNLLDLNESLGGVEHLVSPTRELVKEGKITKISARDGDHCERYLFLFNDLLLVCQSLPLKLGLRQQYTVKAKLDIRGMQVLEGNNLETANTFIIKSKQKSIEFCGGSLEAKDDWQKALWHVISDFVKKELSRNANCIETQFQDKELGKRAPTWVKDQETSMCMICGERFGTFKRRHHCRCCGKVVCNRCSAYKAYLPYDENHELRVCSKCFYALRKQVQTEEKQEEVVLAVDTPGPNRAKAVLKAGAADPSVLNGYLQMSSNKKTWNRKFFAIHSNFVLYSFKAHQDVIAHTSLPLPGCEVSQVIKTEDIQFRDFVFSVVHKALKKTYYFQAEDESQRRRWIDVLSCVIKAELPSGKGISRVAKVEASNDASTLGPSGEVNSVPSSDCVTNPSETVVDQRKEECLPN